MKYGKLNLGQIEAVINRLGGMEGVERFLRGELMVSESTRNTLFNPAEFIGKGWRIDQGDNQLSAAPPDIDPKDIVFKNMHRPGETTLNGEERLRRHREAGNLCLTSDHFLRFWNMRDQLPEEWKRTDRDEIRFIYFDATVLRNSGGNRCTLYLSWSGGAWRWRCGWLGCDFDRQNQSAVGGK